MYKQKNKKAANISCEFQLSVVRRRPGGEKDWEAASLAAFIAPYGAQQKRRPRSQRFGERKKVRDLKGTCEVHSEGTEFFRESLGTEARTAAQTKMTGPGGEGEREVIRRDGGG